MCIRDRAGTIDNPRDMFDQIKLREEDFNKSGRFPSKAEARLASAQEWRKEFYRPDNPVYAKTVSYTHLRAHETVLDLVCRLLLEKKNMSKTRYARRVA